MKNLFTILFLIFFVANSQSQTAVGGCSTVTLTSQDFDPSVDSGYSLTLTSINGQTIKNVELSSDRIDISDLNSGMYIILLERNGQHVFQSKLMVSH